MLWCSCRLLWENNYNMRKVIHDVALSLKKTLWLIRNISNMDYNNLKNLQNPWQINLQSLQKSAFSADLSVRSFSYLYLRPSVTQNLFFGAVPVTTSCPLLLQPCNQSMSLLMDKGAGWQHAISSTCVLLLILRLRSNMMPRLVSKSCFMAAKFGGFVFPSHSNLD